MTDSFQVRNARMSVPVQGPGGPIPSASALSLELQEAAADVQAGAFSAGQARALLARADSLSLLLPPADKARVDEALRLLARTIEAAEARASRGADRVETARPPAATQSASQRARAAEQVLGNLLVAGARGAPPGREAEHVVRHLFGSEGQARATMTALGALREGKLDELLRRTFGPNATAVRMGIEEGVIRQFAARVGAVNERGYLGLARELEGMTPARQEELLAKLRAGDREATRWATRVFGESAARDLVERARAMDQRPGGRAAAFDRLEELCRSTAATAREAAAHYGASAAFLDHRARVVQDTDRSRQQVERELGMGRGSELARIVRLGIERGRDGAETDSTHQEWAMRALGWAVPASGPVGVFAGLVVNGAQAGVERQRELDLRLGAAAGLVSDANLSASGRDADRALANVAVGLATDVAALGLETAVDAARDAGMLVTMRPDALSDAVQSVRDQRLAARLFGGQLSLELGASRVSERALEAVLPGAEDQELGVDPDEAAREAPIDP
jgi:hypothetical protein